MQHYRRQQYLSEQTLERVQERLERLAWESTAKMALLADPTGQELAFCGQLDHQSPEAISALVAGQVGASHELVKALRINSTFTLMIREGPEYNYYLSAPADNYILLLVAPINMPLGWVRHLLKGSHEDFAVLLEAIEAESRTEHQRASLNPEFMSNLMDSMDGLWDEGDK